MPRILDLGCGPNKHPGAIGADIHPASHADVLCDIDAPSLPFADNAFDEVRAIHVIEHVVDILKTMEELHRITRPGGTVLLVTPHYTDFSSFRDPTHRWHLNSYTFEFFTPQGMHGRRYTSVRFHERRMTVRLLRVWKLLGFELLVNHARWFRRFWEHYLSFLIRGKVIECRLEVIKDGQTA